MKPSDISSEAWNAAEVEASVYLVWLGPDATKHESDAHHVLTYSIARAIDAATARERERCAEQAILHGHKVNLSYAVDAPLSSWKLQRLQSTLQTCEDIAREIRAPQNDNFKSVPHMGPIA